MDLITVRIPSAGEPVRLGFRETNGTRMVILDVLVAPGAKEARAALAKWKRGLTRVPPAVSGVGDEAYGEARAYAFARDNIMVAVRVTGDLDARAVIESAAGAVDGAPAGKPVTTPISLEFPARLQSGEHTSISLPSDVLEAQITTTGSATARRHGEQWVVFRTGNEPVSLKVRAVDTLLRAR
jgi:hypothetical protein